MKKIKFKCWTGQEMFIVEEIDFIANCAYERRNIGINDNEGVYSFFGKNEKGVLMQFTGLHDKNGVEIYEGDVVETMSLTGGIFTGQVIYIPEKGRFGWVRLDVNDEFWGMELDVINGSIIGNIYQNPELITNQNEKN